ncbi:unnamed protein product [Haemonchus placei]|uniref:Uncharacterized protein n=1 Tax=Haemonchus placei TaxID=6290 RepID=A0A0N4X600_HAEPC|nr:unnamed protein product [Haemonchus placei]
MSLAFKRSLNTPQPHDVRCCSVAVYYGFWSDVCCSVLIYLLCALVLIRPNPRATMVPSMWARSNPLLGPGFRKVIVPVPDFITQRSADSNVDRGRTYDEV